MSRILRNHARQKRTYSSVDCGLTCIRFGPFHFKAVCGTRQLNLSLVFNVYFVLVLRFSGA